MKYFEHCSFAMITLKFKVHCNLIPPFNILFVLMVFDRVTLLVSQLVHMMMIGNSCVCKPQS